MNRLKLPFVVFIIISGLVALGNLWAGVALLAGGVIGACIGIQGTWSYVRSQFKLEARNSNKENPKRPTEL